MSMARAQRRGHSPARRGQPLAADRGQSVRVDADGNVENPYAQLGEWVDERVHGATAHAHDGNRHSVEVVAWARIIDLVLEKVGGGLHTGKQYTLDDDSVNFVIYGMDHAHMKAVGSKVRTLPAGCELHMGDASAHDVSPAGIARRPHDREFFINVTERAQANLERRRAMATRTHYYDKLVFGVSLILFLVCATMLYKHGEGYRNPFETLAKAASDALSAEEFY